MIDRRHNAGRDRPFIEGLDAAAEVVEEHGRGLGLVDDAHWLDAASAGALLFCARRLGADRVAMVFAAREGASVRFEAPGVREVVLDGESTWDGVGRVAYHVFDLLWLDGRPTTDLPLEERHALLDGLALAPPLGRVARLRGERPWEQACAEGWEGERQH